MTATRPTLDDFLGQVASLSSEQGRALAELARVPDWRRDRDIRSLIPLPGPGGPQMGYKAIAAEDATRSEAAIGEARRIVGNDAVAASRRKAAQALDGLRLSWPGMRLHGPVRVVMWASLVAAAILLVLDPTESDQGRLVVFVLLLSLAFLAWLAGYLLPPSEGDLRYVVELAAVAHVAGQSLADEHFSQLAGGWYAVLEGRWQRGSRPYRAWGCLLVGVVAVILLGVVLEATGAGT